MAGTASPPADQREDARRRVDALLSARDPATTERRAFWAAQFDHGLAWVDFPEGRGGAELSPALQPFVDEQLRVAGAPANWSRNPIGIGVAGPAIVFHGRPDQADRYLRPLFIGDEVWCQLYSEPEAGSDLAAVATRADRVRDGWRVEGRKCWITLAHAARWGLLLARTDPHLPKHQGLTCFVVDMTAPGITVRPQRQMTGQAEFNEVVFADVSVSDEQRLGSVGGGWKVARRTLARERAALGDLVTTRGREAVERAVRLWSQGDQRDPVLRDRLTSLWVETEVARLTSLRAYEMAEKGTPGPEAAVAKLVYAEIQQRISEFCLTLLGPAGLLYESYEMSSPTEMGAAGDDVAKAFLRSRATTIEAGTSEVLRTLLAERVLGLPPEPRVDRDRPWSETAPDPRNPLHYSRSDGE